MSTSGAASGRGADAISAARRDDEQEGHITMEEQMKTYDVAVIGGGAAGLSAAQALGRSRRSVIVIDAGAPRNAPASAMHNYLSRDGMSPLALLEQGRTELVEYGVDVVAAHAVDTRRGDTGFTVVLATGEEVGARRVILAAGLRDRLPEIPGLAEHWGDDVLHCPYCHGWEVRDLRLGVVDSPMAVHQATMFTQWSADVTLFRSPDSPLSPEDAEQLQALGVTIVEATVAAVLGEEGRVRGVELVDGTRHELDALVVMPEFDVDLACVRSLGLTPADHASGLGRFVPVDEGGRTEVPGLWLAGSIANPMAQVMMAAADGLGAGMRVNADLLQEQFAGAVAELRAQRAGGLRP